MGFTKIEVVCGTEVHTENGRMPGYFPSLALGVLLVHPGRGAMAFLIAPRRNFSR
jgi:hypothetical protein